jgi:glucokinase
MDREDKLAIDLMDRAVKALAAGIASAVNLLDPEAVIFGGGMGTRFGESLVPRVEKRMKRHLFVDQNPPAMHVTALGDFGGAIGAALLVASDRQPAPLGAAA